MFIIFLNTIFYIKKTILLDFLYKKTLLLGFVMFNKYSRSIKSKIGDNFILLKSLNIMFNDLFFPIYNMT